MASVLVRRLALAALAVIVFVCAWAAGTPAAQAHPMPHSVVTLDVHEESVDATMELPFDDLRLATGLSIDEDSVLGSERAALEDYILQHVAPTTDDGQAWTAIVTGMSTSDAEQTSTGVYQELIVQLTMTPPPGGSTRSFVFDDDVIIHQVITHKILVVVGEDWSAGAVDGDAQEVGVIAVDTATGEIAPLQVDLGEGSPWSGFAAMVHLGGTHILEGTDHLLFLLVLLLPAPLLAIGGRWRRPAGVRRSSIRIVSITLAFTVGHSVSLAVSALTHLDVPAAPIESLIAVSILVSAAHAIRPLFPGREAVVAGVFGLVHGMAFSFTLAELGLSSTQLVVSLLGFNIGIELMQLAVVLAVLPALMLLSPWRGYAVVRVGVAVVAGVCAVGWLLARLGAPNPLAALADGLSGYGGWAVLALWVLVVGVVTARAVRRSRPHAGDPVTPELVDPSESAAVSGGIR
ncbi:MAG: HupE/UreJ family protein [Microbacterium sp.]|uniref:HupE/UreJ family protein n=1 Tax=Microbacterium sp. TaxID=51671 RepID=UPI0039E6A313